MSRKYRLNNALCAREVQPHQYRLSDIFSHFLQPESVQEFNIFYKQFFTQADQYKASFGKKLLKFYCGTFFSLLQGICISWVANLKVKTTCWHRFVDCPQEDHENSKRNIQKECWKPIHYTLLRLHWGFHRRFKVGIFIQNNPWETVLFICWRTASHYLGRWQAEFITW